MPICLPPNLPRRFLTCFYLLQAVAAEVEQLQVFARQELLGLQVCDAVPRQVHLDDVNRQPGRDVVQIYRKTKNRRDVKTQDVVSAKIVHGAEMMTRQN